MARRYADESSGQPTKLPESYRLPAPCGPECCRSALAACANHKADFAQDYLRWASAERRIQDHEETLHDWCAQRFGGRLYPSAFAILRFEVKVALYGDPYRRERREKREAEAVVSNPDPSFLEKALRSMPQATLFANEEPT